MFKWWKRLSQDDKEILIFFSIMLTLACLGIAGAI